MPFAPKNKIAFIAFLLIFAASWLFNLYYAHNYVGTEMKHDLFRQVDVILAPLWSGDGSLSLLWSNHHASPVLGHVTHFGVLNAEVSHFCLHPHHAELKSFQVKAIQ